MTYLLAVLFQPSLSVSCSFPSVPRFWPSVISCLRPQSVQVRLSSSCFVGHSTLQLGRCRFICSYASRRLIRAPLAVILYHPIRALALLSPRLYTIGRILWCVSWDSVTNLDWPVLLLGSPVFVQVISRHLLASVRLLFHPCGTVFDPSFSVLTWYDIPTQTKLWTSFKHCYALPVAGPEKSTVNVRGQSFGA